MDLTGPDGSTQKAKKTPRHGPGSLFVPRLQNRNYHDLLRGLRLEKFLEQDLIPCQALVQFVDNEAIRLEF